MNLRSIIIYISLIITTLSTISCEKGNNEGTIKYDIEFNEKERETNSIIDMLPNTMNYYFKNESSISEISYMGMFRTAYISNVDDKTNSILFYLMRDKYFCTTKFGEKTLGYDPMPGVHLEETKETKDIKGIKAIKVHVTFDDKSIEPYDIWYTKQFKVHNPNWHTPYKEITGVLLDYRIKMKGISMHLTMSEFSDSPVDTAKFSIAKSYKAVTVPEMDAIFDKNLKMFE